MGLPGMRTNGCQDNADGMLCLLLPTQDRAASQPAGNADARPYLPVAPGMPWPQALTLDEYEAKQKKT